MTIEEPLETDPRSAAGSGPILESPSGAAAGPSEDRSGVEELIRQHRELDDRLREFAAAGRLTPAEEHEAAVMKKRKLALKDRITALGASS